MCVPWDAVEYTDPDDEHFPFSRITRLSWPILVRSTTNLSTNCGWGAGAWYAPVLANLGLNFTDLFSRDGVPKRTKDTPPSLAWLPNILQHRLEEHTKSVRLLKALGMM